MIRKVILMLLLMSACLVSQMEAQKYFSHVVHTEGSVNIQGFSMIDNERLAISYLGTVDSLSGSILIDFDLLTRANELYGFAGYLFCRDSPISHEEDLVVYTDDKNRGEAASFLRISKDGEIVNNVDYPEWEEDMGVREMYHFADYLYNVSIVKREEFPKGLFIINKTDFDGEIKWQKTYGEEDSLKLTVFRDADLDNEQNILIGAGIVDYSRNGTYSRIMKMDTAGYILHQYTDTLEPCVGLESNQQIVTFPSGVIVHQTSLDKLFAEEYALNDWWIFPTKYSWFDQNVNLLRDTVYNTDIDDEEFIQGITAGRGDYFFSYGKLYEFPDDTYGIIHKIGLDGTILWSKKYKDPANIGVDDSYNIDKFFEMDNGDLITVGTYNNIQLGILDPWVMRLNAHGCMSGDDCGDLVLSVQEVVIQEEIDHTITIYPNPIDRSTRILKIEQKLSSGISIENIRISSLDGSAVFNDLGLEDDVIHLPVLDKGLYYIQFYLSDGRIITQSIMIL